MSEEKAQTYSEHVSEKQLLDIIISYHEFTGIPFPVDDKPLKFVKDFGVPKKDTEKVKPVECRHKHTIVTADGYAEWCEDCGAFRDGKEWFLPNDRKI